MSAVRQGDVLLVPVEVMPEGKRLKGEAGRLILARGEATGHHHSVAVADVEAVETAEGIFLRIMRATPLEHQEHGALTLEPGIVKVVRQREHQPGELPRRVLD